MCWGWAPSLFPLLSGPSLWWEAGLKEWLGVRLQEASVPGERSLACGCEGAGWLATPRCRPRVCPSPYLATWLVAQSGGRMWLNIIIVCLVHRLSAGGPQGRVGGGFGQHKAPISTANWACLAVCRSWGGLRPGPA